MGSFNRLGQTSLSDMEYKSCKIIQSEEEKMKKEWKNEDSPQDLYDTIKWTNIHTSW